MISNGFTNIPPNPFFLVEKNSVVTEGWRETYEKYLVIATEEKTISLYTSTYILK